MDFYEEFEFVVGNDGYSIALRTPPRSEERSAKIHALWESRTRFVRRRLSNVGFIRHYEIPYRSRARKPCSASSNYSNYSNYFDPKQYARTDNYSSLESSSPCASHSSRLSINRINRSPIHESRKYESKVLLEAHLPRNTATIRV